ncbi:aspartic peptidase domain-containing protein, partial [Paraphoma chrysanthemicola]
GDDGPWSSFRIGVGENDTQQIRVLPANTQSSTLLVIPEACSSMLTQAGKSCTDQRGGLFMRNESKSWQYSGQYVLDTFLEERVGVEGDGLFGFDSLSLGWNGDGLPTIAEQSVAGIITPSLALGSLALNPRPINFTNYNNPVASLLQNLRNISTPIPSLSWSYTAGAYNLAPKVFGSLVLGGYDSTRFEPNNVTFPFGADDSLDLQVAIQRISVNGTRTSLQSSPIISYMSTLIPDIWLPFDTCTEFSKAFGLTFNTTSKEFYVNSTMHQLNLERNPIVSMRVGPEATGDSVTIQLPYWNFYLATRPGTNASDDEGTFRFPIRPASNDTQYILGRAFLQSAYVSADYERGIFNLSQAVFPSSSTRSKIVAILPREPVVQKASKKGLSTGVISGIVAGSVIALLTLVAVLVLLFYRRRVQRKKKTEGPHELDDTDMLNAAAHEVGGEDKRHEVPDGPGLKHEMLGDSNPKIELSACAEQEKPAEAADTQVHVYELPANEKKYVEMEGEGHFKEMG